jgi:hypothetical protein
MEAVVIREFPANDELLQVGINGIRVFVSVL